MKPILEKVFVGEWVVVAASRSPCSPESASESSEVELQWSLICFKGFKESRAMRCGRRAQAKHSSKRGL